MCSTTTQMGQPLGSVGVMVAFRSAVVCAVVLVASCSAPTDVTSVRLSVRYDDAWSLSELDVRIGERTGRKPAAHELRVLVPDEWDGQSLEVDVAGLRGGERYAHGQTTVTPVLGREVSVEVVLARLPCGAWCTEGATQCEGDGTVICEQRDDDTCMEWGDVTACGGDTHCSLGACRAECIEECAEGETRCEGPVGVRTCGQADDDPCMDWLPVVACAEGETCSNGACAATCQDECAAGQTDCLGGGVIACGDLNEDGCLEWGPATPCGAGESCEAGACQPLDSCEDQCTASTCTGLTLRQCGNYDEDPCLEPSPGTSCVPSDPCMEGRCTPNGCESTAKVCMDPPDPECVDGDTRRTYAATGTCSAGRCDYAPTETTCANGCEGGECSGDPCAGVVCDAPSEPVCVDADTLRTYGASGTCTGGACSYPSSTTSCAGGCSSGACLSSCGSASCASTPEEVWDGVFIRGGPDIAVDASDAPHVVFYDDEAPWEANPVLHAVRRSGSWVVDTIELADSAHSALVVAVDGSNVVHAAFAARASGTIVRHATKPVGGSTWARHTIAAGWDPDLSVEFGGPAHFTFTRFDSVTSLNQLHRVSPGAGLQLIDPIRNVENNVNGVAWDGTLHVAYLPVSGGGLYYASASDDPFAGWLMETIAPTLQTRRSGVALAVDATGVPHVAFYDRINENLYYASRATGTWLTEVVAGSSCGYPAIAIDSGIVHVVDCDDSVSGLRYHRGTAGDWDAVTFADGEGGSHVAMALDSVGRIHVAYRADLDVIGYVVVE